MQEHESFAETSPTALPVLFIGGIGRSGTTVFELSLGTDERVVPLGEVVHLWQRSLIDDEPCGCGEPFSQCSFWTEVGAKAFGGWDRVDAERVLTLRHRIDRTVRTPQLAARVGGPAWHTDVREYASYYSRIYRAAVEVSGSSVVVDSSKQASLPYVLRYADGLDVRVLHCVRDSRAVAYSWTKQVARPDATTPASRYMTRYPPAVLAVKWLQHNLVIDGLRLGRLPTMLLRYEDWADDPVAAYRSTLAFAGLEPRANDHVAHNWVDLPTTHTCSGNPMRFTTGRVGIRRDESWKSSLPRRSRALVTALTAPLLATYGYRRAPR